MNEDRATRYHRLKRQAAVASLVWRVGLLGGLLWSGFSFTLRGAAESAASLVGVAGAWNSCASVVFYVALLALVNETGGLPLEFYTGFVLDDWKGELRLLALGALLFLIGRFVERRHASA